MGVTGDVAKEATRYLQPLFYASPVISFYHVFSRLTFGLGYIKMFTIMLIIPIIFSIAVISPVMILWLNLGAYGAALAIIISYTLSVVVYIVYYLFFEKMLKLFNTKGINFSLRNKSETSKQSLKNLVKVLHIGLPEMVGIYSWVVTIAVGYKFLSIIATDLSLYQEISAIWGIISRFMTLTFGITSGFNVGPWQRLLSPRVKVTKLG
jgi:Na+-driven multidrug efflux pump